jgi:hypothetical protein
MLQIKDMMTNGSKTIKLTMYTGRITGNTSGLNCFSNGIFAVQGNPSVLS